MLSRQSGNRLEGSNPSPSASEPKTLYRTIVADPPWEQALIGQFPPDRRHGRTQRRFQAQELPYQTLSLEEISALDVERLADIGCHLWLWTTNSHLEDSFSVVRSWGFKYLTTVTWVKPAGIGAWFANTTQHVLFGYYKKCLFPQKRYAKTHFTAPHTRHSIKPEAFLDLVEAVSPGPRLEMFSRRARLGWDTWGDEALHGTELIA